jgi:hypothetical protein
VQLEEKRDAGCCALGWTETTTGARVRARWRSRSAVPRRADDRSRSAGATPVVGLDRGIQEGGADHPADDALHG